MKQMLLFVSIIFLGCDVGTPSNSTKEKQNKADTSITGSNKDTDSLKRIEDKKKMIGLMSIKESSIAKVNDVSLKFSSITSTKDWIHDSYGEEYRYHSAERGNIFIVAKTSISAETKDPSLPPISVFCIVNDELSFLGNMDYKFSKWEDYGTFLGNYADYGNDFAHTKTISFTCGLEISNTNLSIPLLVAVRKENCYERNVNRFGSPPVTYRANSSITNDFVTINDFEKNYIIVKIFNKNGKSASVNKKKTLQQEVDSL